MNDDRLEISRSPGGPHHTLLALVGEWEGVTRTWFEPENLADKSQTVATIRPILDGRFVLHEYAGSLMGKPMKGLAIYGCYLEKQLFQSAWIDNLHMENGIMFSEGDVESDHISVLGSYGDTGGGPPWGWRTEVKLIDSNQLVITAFNITPDGLESKAVETRYKRKK